MGSCLSKKSTICSSSSAIPEPPDESKSNTDLQKKKKAEEGTVTVKKEIFVIKHRKSHDFDRRSEEEKAGANQKATTSTNTTTTSTTSEEIEFCNNGSISSTNVMNGGLGNGGVIVRTSSCTKEEVDAILIQCGRLSRSSSIDKTALSSSGGRKYSGSKRSYDFDCDTVKGNEIQEGNHNDNVVDGDGDGMAAERIHRHRQRQRQLRAASSPSHGRRRTPSRERDQRQPDQQRSGSRERGGGSGGGRRVSRSPGRRSESPIPTSNGVSGVTPLSANASGTSTKPGKMVSVPATVSSLAMDKSNNGGGGGGSEPLSGTTIKRISVKRNASPRSRSPAIANVSVSIDNQNAHFNQHLQQPLSLSRSNSRKAEHSPYRRIPLSEIDANIPPSHKSANNNNILLQKPMVENASNNKVVHQGAENKISNGKGAVDKVVNVDCRAKNHQLIVEEAKGVPQVTRDTTVPAVGSGDESLKPQTLTRSRSSRRSRDLDLNPEALLNPNPSYTALLLEDIHNFHQKNTTTFSLPACVTKACSILEAVADLNSSTSSNLSCTLSDDRRSPMSQQFNKHGYKFSSAANPPAGKKRLDTKDPFAESEVVVADDLMEPSLHKYVTVRRGTMGEGDIEDQESSGSNSIVGGQQHWVSSSSWEPNSADSTDCWTTSSSNNASEDVRSRLGLGRQTFSESGCHMMNEAQRRLMSGKKRVVSDHQQIGIGRGRDGTTGKGLHTMPTTAAAST